MNTFKTIAFHDADLCFNIWHIMCKLLGLRARFVRLLTPLAAYHCDELSADMFTGSNAVIFRRWVVMATAGSMVKSLVVVKLITTDSLIGLTDALTVGAGVLFISFVLVYYHDRLVVIVIRSICSSYMPSKNSHVISQSYLYEHSI